MLKKFCILLVVFIFRCTCIHPLHESVHQQRTCRFSTTFFGIFGYAASTPGRVQAKQPSDNYDWNWLKRIY